MALVNVASTYPYSVQINSDPPSEYEDPLYIYDIVGTGDPGAVGGFGITMDVEDVAYNDWTTAHPDLADGMSLVTQGDIDNMTDLASQYGYELFLPPEGTLMASDKFGDFTVVQTHEALAAAALQRREAETQLREADALRRQADSITESATIARDAAAEAQDAAAAALNEKAQPLRQATAEAHVEQEGAGGAA